MAELYARGSLTTSELIAIAVALETAAGASTTASNTREGYWKRIARASETLAGIPTLANDIITGYMLRSAAGLEVVAGTSGAEENATYEGYIKRMVDALEVEAGAVTTGILEKRLITAAQTVAAGAVPVTLGALGLTPVTVAEDTVYNGAITGRTAGSTLTATSSDGTVLTIVYTPTIVATGMFTTPGTPTITITETKVGATNTPRNSAFGFTVTAAPVTLAALGLTPTTVNEDLLYSGTITGRTTGSTLTATSSDGTVLTVTGTTVTGTFANPGTPTITVTETLAGATNTPRNSLFSFTVNAAGTITLTWTSNDTTYDPVFSFTGIIESDLVELQIDDDVAFGSLYGSGTNTVDALEAENGILAYPGIPTLGFATTYNARARRNGGAWSNTASKLMAPQTPVLSLPTIGALGATTATVGITTDVGNGNLRLVVSTTNVRPSDAQFDAGQDSTGAAAAFTNNQAIASSGAKTANATGLTANTVYYPFWRHTSGSGGKGYFNGTTFTTNAVSLYNNVGVFGSAGAFGESSKSITGIVVGTAGMAIIFTNTYSGAVPTTLTFGGVSCTLRDTEGALQVWTCAITAGTHTLTLSNGAGNLYAFTASVGTVVGGTFVATTKDAASINVTGGTPSLAKPASGGIVAALGFEEQTVPASPTLSVVSPSTEVAQGSHALFNGESRGLVVAERPSTGEVIFDINGQFKPWPRIALSYQV